MLRDESKRNSATYLESLRANTRYQIRRSKALYEERYGPLNIKIASNREEAIQFFREAGPLHIARWEDSGFKNTQFLQFHENLIRECYEAQIDCIELRAGKKTIAIMYYHIVDKNVYFYLHGLHYDLDPKLKPGLVAHSLATQHYLDNGMDRYDYMGGYSQYKLQLAEQVEDLVTVCIQRSKLKFSIENLGRNIRRLISPGN